MSTSIPDGASFIDVGWGRLIFAHTFPDPRSVAELLLDEKPDQRDIAFYVNDPQLVLSVAPQSLFLDPSTTYRLKLSQSRPSRQSNQTLQITGIESRDDLVEINRIYSSQGMVPVDPEVLWRGRDDRRYDYFVARPQDSRQVVGVALGVDHAACFDDLFNSCSLWALAVDPQTEYPSVGVTLVRHLAATFARRGREIMDLSVLQDNEAAIALYQGLGFERVPVFAVKRRNQVNEPLYVTRDVREGYNPYATIIIDEALRRGITVEPLDPPRGYFRLMNGNRRVTCWESLCDLTTSIAMCRCADKQLTSELLKQAGLNVPAQIQYTTREAGQAFLEEFRRVVVKPAVGEQGQGVHVDLDSMDAVVKAVGVAAEFDDKVLLEQFVEGIDLRVIVINMEVVAGAIRKPAEVVGTGRHAIRRLIEKVSRRRSAATGGESQIPFDDETQRCVLNGGFQFDDVLPEGQVLQVRRTANLHTGGTIEDVTSSLSPKVQDAAVQAALALEIPVVGLDFLVPDIASEEYTIVEANERPGLANHEPQPTAVRFIDLLFPQTIHRASLR